MSPTLYTTNTSSENAIVTKVEKGEYTIHSYLSPEWAEMVCSQIIETPFSLLIVDAQLLTPQAQAVRAYANSLGKPIQKIIISHGHPDHWAGLEAFQDIPAYALPETIFEITNYGQAMLDSKKPAFGDQVTSRVSVPAPLILERETIDGLELVYLKNTDTESTFSIMVELPQLNLLIAQDIVYNGVYPYIGDRSYVTKAYCFENWINVLAHIKTKGYQTIFGGHGLPADASICDTMIETLTFEKAVFEAASDGDELKQWIRERYPDHKVVDMLDLSVSMLYNNPYGY